MYRHVSFLFFKKILEDRYQVLIVINSKKAGSRNLHIFIYHFYNIKIASSLEERADDIHDESSN